MADQTDNKKLGMQMRHARESTIASGNRFSVVAMARVLEVNPDTVTRWESGEVRPPLDRLVQYCSVLQARGLADSRSLQLISAGYQREVAKLLKFGAKSSTEKDEQAQMGRLDYGIPITSPEMLDKVYAFDEHAYVDEHKTEVQDIDKDLFRGWWEAHPNGFLCSLMNDEPFAVVGLFPVVKDWAEDFVQRRKSEFDLEPHLIAKQSSTYWYLSGLSSAFSPKGLSSHLPSILGFSLARWLDANTPYIRDQEVTIVSEGTTPIGSKMLNRLFDFKLESGSTSKEKKPRFSKVTTLANIKNLLIGSEFFSHATGLREKVQSGL